MTDEVYIREPGVDDCEHLEVCEHACRMWCRSYKPRVDRDALRAMADEMERVADGNRLTGMMSIVRARSWADGIRKALGVER